jgi:Flp pilus assembly CpaE family ATPase
VINQADRRGAIRIADIEGSIKHPVAAVIPVDERAVFMAANQGVPLIVSFRNSPVTQAITALAKRLAGELAADQQQADSQTAEAAAKSGRTGLLGRFFG